MARMLAIGLGPQQAATRIDSSSYNHTEFNVAPRAPCGGEPSPCREGLDGAEEGEEQSRKRAVESVVGGVHSIQP